MRKLAGRTIDAKAIILGLALPGRVSDRVAAAYEKHLFGIATLQELPDAPRFVINAHFYHAVRYHFYNLSNLLQPLQLYCNIMLQ